MTIIDKIREIEEDLEDKIKALQMLPPTDQTLADLKKAEAELKKFKYGSDRG